MKQNIIDTIALIIGTTFTLTQTNELFRLISFILTSLSALLILVSKVIDWYHKAKKDGKITADEVKELVDTVKDDIDDINDHTKSNN